MSQLPQILMFADAEEHVTELWICIFTTCETIYILPHIHAKGRGRVIFFMQQTELSHPHLRQEPEEKQWGKNLLNTLHSPVWFWLQ